LGQNIEDDSKMTEALRLLFTGMGTVFFILILVVLLGNLIIRVTNRFAPAPIASAANSDGNNSGIEPSKLTAIISAVEIATQGKGKVISVQKHDK